MSGPGVDGPPTEAEGDARLSKERLPIVLSGEEQARVKNAMARGSAQFLDGVLHGASRAGGADVQRTVDSLQKDGRHDARQGVLHPSPAQGTRRAIRHIFNRVRKQVDGHDRVCASLI